MAAPIVRIAIAINIVEPAAIRIYRAERIGFKIPDPVADASRIDSLSSFIHLSGSRGALDITLATHMTSSNRTIAEDTTYRTINLRDSSVKKMPFLF